MEENTSRSWLWRILDFINPLRDPSLTVAAVLTFVEEAGQPDSWYSIILIALVNWLAVRGVVWLIVNSAFASIFIGRRVWWAIQHPRLAWRLLDAIGHEEIVGIVIVASFAAGLNVYATVATLGLLGHTTYLQLPPKYLQACSCSRAHVSWLERHTTRRKQCLE